MDMVKSWHQEKQHYSFPHPRECNPRCPSKCSGSVCSHYTQVSTAAPRHPRAKGGLVQLTALLLIQDQTLATASSRSGSSPGSGTVSAGGMPVMLSYLGHSSPGRSLEEQLGPSEQLTRRFPFF